MNGWQIAVGLDNLKVSELRSIYLQNRSRPEFPREVLSLLEQLDADLGWRAVWLMCRLADDGLLREAEQCRLVDCVDASEHWAWRLLVCQLFGRVACPADRRDDLFPFLRRCLGDRRVIVRAWSLTAMWLFRDDVRYRDEIHRALRSAKRDTGKAMMARLRLLAAAGKRVHGTRRKSPARR